MSECKNMKDIFHGMSHVALPDTIPSSDHRSHVIAGMRDILTTMGSQVYCIIVQYYVVCCWYRSICVGEYHDDDLKGKKKGGGYSL